MKELHERTTKGHFAIEITHKKILDARYKWATMYNNFFRGTIHEMGPRFYGTN
jgi:hypothetical protein